MPYVLPVARPYLTLPCTVEKVIDSAIPAVTFSRGAEVELTHINVEIEGLNGTDYIEYAIMDAHPYGLVLLESHLDQPTTYEMNFYLVLHDGECALLARRIRDGVAGLWTLERFSTKATTFIFDAPRNSANLILI